MRGMTGRMMYLIVLLVVLLLLLALFYAAGNKLIERLFIGGLG